MYVCMISGATPFTTVQPRCLYPPYQNALLWQPRVCSIYTIVVPLPPNYIIIFTTIIMYTYVASFSKSDTFPQNNFDQMLTFNRKLFHHFVRKSIKFCIYLKGLIIVLPGYHWCPVQNGGIMSNWK